MFNTQTYHWITHFSWINFQTDIELNVRWRQWFTGKNLTEEYNWVPSFAKSEKQNCQVHFIQIKECSMFLTAFRIVHSNIMEKDN